MATKTLRKVSLADATHDQLREYAQTVLGLSLSNRESDEQLRAKMDAVQPGLTEIIVSIAPEVIPTQRAKPEVPPVDGNTKLMIMIHNQQSAGGKEPVFVGHNGVGMYIPRGKQVPVAKKYVDILMAAVETMYEQQVDEGGKPGPLIATEVARYPFQVFGLAADNDNRPGLAAVTTTAAPNQ